MDQREIDNHLAAILQFSNLSEYPDAEKRVRHEKALSHQSMLRAEYGKRRGWVQQQEGFSVQALARVTIAGEEWDREFTDHRSFWVLAGQPVAVVAHLYGCDERCRDAARSWAARRGLQVEFPVDFPSWWYPGRTTLIQITRLPNTT